MQWAEGGRLPIPPIVMAGPAVDPSLTLARKMQNASLGDSHLDAPAAIRPVFDSVLRWDGNDEDRNAGGDGRDPGFRRPHDRPGPGAGIAPIGPATTVPGGASTAPAKPKTTRAASTGPIRVEQRIPDGVLRGFLSRFLPRYPGVRALSVEVDDGVVLLRGRADREDTLEEITDVVERVEGVRLVLNQMGTDEEVMTAWEFAGRELAMLRTYLGRKWLLILLSAAVVAASAMLARLFSSRAEILLSPFVGNVLLRSVLGSVISSLMVIGGFLLALGALGLTHVVLSILGLASIAGLAVGFAFRDITENFIASVLLGVRRPFQIGDYVTVAGHSGVVKSLNTRATVLVTLEGNHVRIPNATVFKEIMVNSTASPSSRHSFDVLIPHEASLSGAIEAINKALGDQPGILREPPPRALVESLEPSGALRPRLLLVAGPGRRLAPAPQRRQPQGQGRPPARRRPRAGRHGRARRGGPLPEAPGQRQDRLDDPVRPGLDQFPPRRREPGRRQPQA